MKTTSTTNIRFVLGAKQKSTLKKYESIVLYNVIYKTKNFKNKLHYKKQNVTILTLEV
jgi:hypothetical protein